MPSTGLPDHQSIGMRAAGWSLVFATALLVAQLLDGVTGGWVYVRSDYQAGAWWQLLSAQWVHFGLMHATANAVAFAFLFFVFQNRVPRWLQWLALWGGYVAVAVAIGLDPNCAFYAGASGALHGLLAGSALALLLFNGTETDGGDAVGRFSKRRMRALGLATLIGLAIKLMVQRPNGVPDLGWLGFASYTPAHEAGVLGGLIAVLMARLVYVPWFIEGERRAKLHDQQ